jgi:DNA-binding GntR family transcriptional regulator
MPGDHDSWNRHRAITVKTMPRSPNKPGARSQGASTAEIVQAIEEDIILGRLMPRERLVEEDLMGRFGATRHIVRQALGELERVHIVDHIPNRGALVRSYSVEEVRQLYELRDMLEAHAVTLMTMPASKEAIAALKMILARHERAIERDDLIAIYRENIAFHRALFGLSSNAFLVEAIIDSTSRTQGVRHNWLSQPVYLLRSRAQHRAMIEALEGGDRERLQALCREHSEPSRDEYIRLAPKR